MSKYLFILLISWLSISSACEQFDNVKNKGKFDKIDTERSGISFENSIIENDTLNYYTFPYLYMGGGVAVGDINNDGLQDVFFTGNLTSNKLYLNQGDFKFLDISQPSGIEGDDRWYTGASMVDINNDGWLDIYLCVSGIYQTTKNELYINNKDNTFTESAESYGLADETASIQATYLDYNGDGLLDVFVANYPQIPVSQSNQFYYNVMQENRLDNSAHLYRNNGDRTFTDVTSDAGVKNFGLTLGVVSSDFNNDNLTDIYLSNDFAIPDYLYLNNGDGTFKEVLKESVGHTAIFGMGFDAADFNNDGFLDLAQMDMTPSDHFRSKTNMASMSPSSFYQSVELGFHYQYMQNTLQLNNGSDINGIPQFSDIARMTGFATTDWSWGPLFADFDNDGQKDIVVTNGLLRDVNNNDVLQEFDKAAFFKSVKDYTKLPSTPLSNYLFRNEGDLAFSKKTEDWGLQEKGFSNGVSYADLDNDGSLDLIINNVNAPASIYKNSISSSNRFITVELIGPAKNPFGIGAKTIVTSEDKKQYIESTMSRGFQSSVEPLIHFGLGEAKIVDEIKVEWPDGRISVLKDVSSNSKYKIAHEKSIEVIKEIEGSVKRPFNKDENSGITFRHKEDDYNDFANEPLLPHKNSNLGSDASTGDINGNGLKDIFIGNAKGSEAKMFVQESANKFMEMPGPWEDYSDLENVGSSLTDFDGDGDLDLLVAYGSNNPSLNKSNFQPGLFINNGGVFRKVELPEIAISGKVILPMDFDEDGDMDVFLGARIRPGQYPFPPTSIMLENLGGENDFLKFKKLGVEEMSELSEIGMVTSAIWEDIDGDNSNELVLTGEWLGIEVFQFIDGIAKNKTADYGLVSDVGWWRSLMTVDVDQDGDLDLVAGNLGLNYKYRASREHPFSVYASDFDENGRSDIVLSYEKKGKNLPLRGRECSSEQVPAIAKRFETYESFAKASLEDIYGDNMLENALHYEATSFEHTWFENMNGKFMPHSLPALSQISSIETMVSFDYNGDQYPDLLIAGNLHQAEVETTRNDASIGLVLKGTNLGFVAVPPIKSGLMVRGEVRSIKKLSNESFLFVLNDQQVQIWDFSQSKELSR
ncbi:MAG: VCBS repeat-containing protein [Reichenbachiella sp.]